MNMADIAWTNNPGNVGAANNQGWTTDWILGSLSARGSATYTIRNQTNETVHIDCYYCKARQNFFHQGLQTAAGYANLYSLLGEGFAMNGIDNNTVSALNQALTINDYNIYQSHGFCKIFKVMKQERIQIQPGKIKKRSIAMKTVRVIPNDITANEGTTLTRWPDRVKRWDYMRHEKFILFRLRGSIAGAVLNPGNTPQITMEKIIEQNTPTVILYAQFKYRFQHFPRTSVPDESARTFGMDTGSGFNPRIIIDNTLVAGTEVDVGTT